MDTTLRQFRMFLAVVEAESFTDAARRISASQSSVSRAVTDLESALGVRLLERDTRNVELTAAGRVAQRLAGELLDVHESVVRTMRRFATGDAGTVTLSTLPSVAAALLPDVMKSFRTRHPDIAMRMRDGLEGRVLEDVLNGTADFAITTLSHRSERLRSEPLIRDEVVALLPVGHPLGDQDTVCWSDLVGHPFVALGHASSVRRITDGAFSQIGGADAWVTEVGSIPAVGGLVAAGLGVSALPSLVLTMIGANEVICRRLVDPVVFRPLDVVRRTRTWEVPPAGQHFLDALAEMRASDHPLPAGVSWA